jgi:ATP-dependent RNA helicase DeaD
MQKFRLRNLQLLVATDVAARGLDVDDLTHVVNYSLPDDTEVYTHRSGRTGRAGKKGISISLISSREMHNLRQIEKLVKRPFETMRIPSGSDICGKQLFHWAKKIETVVTEHQEIEKFLPVISEKLSSLDREELLRRVVSLEFDRFLDDYRDGEEIHSPREDKEAGSSSGKKEKGREFSGKYTRLFINLGKTDGFYPEQLIDLVNRNTQGKKVSLGRIDLMKTFSFFEVDQEYADFLINALNKSKFNDRRVSVEIAQEKGTGNEGRGRDGKKDKWNDKRQDRKKDRKHDKKFVTRPRRK